VLAANAALANADPARARSILAAAQQAGMDPAELDLIAGNIDGAPIAALNRIWRRAQLAGVRLERGDAPLLDRLAPKHRWLPARRQRGAPLVSVIVPAFNAAATLPTALASLTRQSWKSLDIVVVDDGSTDGTGDVARRIAEGDARIRVIDAGANEGAYAARNRGAAAAKGAYLTVLDADDWAHPERIARQVRALIEAPALMGSLSHWVRATPGLTFTRWRVEPEGLIHRNVSSLMIRREVLDRLGVWDRVRVSADTEYYYRIIAAYGGAALTEVLPGVPLSLGRSGAGNLTGQAATHLSSQIGGVRAAYLEAAARWHGRAASAPADGDTHPLFLPAHPARRPFAVPPRIGLGDPEAVLHPDDVIRTSPFFDVEWYLEVNPDVRKSGVDAALHYLQSGAAQGRDPSPRFSSSGYRLAYLPDDPEANPLLHWHDEGQVAGLSPLPRFEGALAPAKAEIVVFAHQAGQHVFGSERSLLDMLGRMIAAGQTPLVVLPHIHNADYLTALQSRATAVQILPYRWRRQGRAVHHDTAAALADLLRDAAPRAVHINTVVLDAPAIAARSAGLPVTVHLRERPDEDTALCNALGMDGATLRGLLLDEADHFVANGPGVVAWIAAPDRTTITANQIDPALFDLPAPSGKPPRVALISSNIAKKGVADFVQMATRLAAENVTARCLLIGPESADLAALRPLPGNVEAPGYAADACAALSETDIVVNLSHFAESFGRTVLEAMAAARPVVCYARGHLPELVEDAVSGLLVPPDDADAAARAVAKLIADPALRARMGAAGRLRARAILGLSPP
jgi:glycosyltransferase involved in cell wall biosynthesis